MIRRRFLSWAWSSLGIVAATAYAPGRAAGIWRAPFVPTTDALCSSRRPTPQAIVGRSSGALRYQGTHILAYGALREVSERYGTSNPGAIEVTGGGCDDGIAGVTRGGADLGGLCCPVKGSAAEGLPYLLVARDLKAVVVHPLNPVGETDLARLRAAAAGRIARWKGLGGEDRALAFVIRNHCPNYLEPVRDLLLRNEPGWTARGLFVDTDEQIVDLVSRFVGSIGIVSWVFAKPLAEQGRLKVVAIDGLRPSDAGAALRYALIGPLSLIFRAWDSPRMAPFFDFLYGAEGRRIVARALVPVDAQEAGYARFRRGLSA
jgi:phosphate transport system substrate-binding protein